MAQFLLESTIPFRLSYFSIHYSSWGWVLQLSLHIVENPGVDPLLHDNHCKLWTVETNQKGVECAEALTETYL